MLKRILSGFIVVIVAFSVFAGCGASKSTESAAPKGMTDQASHSVVAAGVTKSDTAYAGAAADSSKARETATQTAEAPKAPSAGAPPSSIVTGDSQLQQVSNAILSQRKVIMNANISVEVDDFEKAYGQIKSMISAFGYVQESGVKRDKRYIEGKEVYVTKGVIIIRVDRDKFESVLSSVRGLGTLLDESVKSDDVTDKFFDTESRVRVLKIEQEKLEEFLKKLNDPDTIFKTQSRLTQIRQEIEGLTGTLRKWDSLVQLSTITINMNERPVQIPPEKGSGYWSKLGKDFTDSFAWLAEFFGALLVFLVKAVPVLILIGLLGIIALWLYRRVLKKVFAGLLKKQD